MFLFSSAKSTSFLALPLLDSYLGGYACRLGFRQDSAFVSGRVLFTTLRVRLMQIIVCINLFLTGLHYGLTTFGDKRRQWLLASFVSL